MVQKYTFGFPKIQIGSINGFDLDLMKREVKIFYFMI